MQVLGVVIPYLGLQLSSPATLPQIHAGSEGLFHAQIHSLKPRNSPFCPK